jgi:hypothetical protein
VIEEHLAQVILHALAQHTRKVNEYEDERRLHQQERAVDPRDLMMRSVSLRLMPSSTICFVQEREVRVHARRERNGDQKSQHPLPVRLESVPMRQTPGAVNWEVCSSSSSSISSIFSAIFYSPNYKG